MKKLAIVITHPIQYFSPIFKLLAIKVKVKVFYTWEQGQDKILDEGFGRIIKWDIPLLEGYEYTFLKNKAKEPGINKFFGIKNPDLIRKIEEWGADSLLVFGWNFFSHLQVMRYFKGKIPIYFRGDSTLLNETAGFRKILRRIFLTWVYRHIDYALYVGENNRAYFKAHGLKDHQLIFAPHAIDNSRFQQDLELNNIKGKEWRRTLGIPDSDIVLLYVGKIEPVKDIPFFLKCFLELNLANLSLVIVGNGVLEAEVKKLAEGNEKIKFLPFQNQSQMPLVYHLGDILVLPSKSETWGLVVNEAMACGLPVLVSDKVGCAADLVSDKVNGIIFTAGSEIDLKGKITWIASKGRDDFESMGEKSLSIIKNWCFEAIVDVI